MDWLIEHLYFVISNKYIVNKCISLEPSAKTNRQWCQVGWMLAHHEDGLTSSSFSLTLDGAVDSVVSGRSVGCSVCFIVGSTDTWVWILVSLEYSNLSDRSEIWQALRQHCCQCACQISKRCDNLKYQSRGFETSRDLTKRRIFGYWDGALSPFDSKIAGLCQQTTLPAQGWHFGC